MFPRLSKRSLTLSKQGSTSKTNKAKGYAVFCKAGKGSYKRVGVTKKTTFVVKKLKKGKKYSFQVKAFIKNGKTFVYGKASKAKTLKVK